MRQSSSSIGYTSSTTISYATNRIQENATQNVANPEFNGPRPNRLDRIGTHKSLSNQHFLSSLALIEAAGMLDMEYFSIPSSLGRDCRAP